MALCLEERSSCGSKRRKTKEAERERKRERERAVPRGSIHHTSGGVIRTWEEGFEVWTSKRAYTHFQKYVGLKQMRSLRCPHKVQNKTKGRKRTSSSTAAATSTETLEGNNKDGRQHDCCPVTGSLVLRFARKCFAGGTVHLSKELHTISNRMTTASSTLSHQLNI